MPELPEVEVTCQGLMPSLVGRKILDIKVRNYSLRFPIPEDIVLLCGGVIDAVQRRAKYILLRIGSNTAVLHLGMTGHLSVVPLNTPVEKHDHYDFILDNDMILRYNDPRRFGALLWTSGDPNAMKVLSSLGVEPLSELFSAQYLYDHLLKCKGAIKLALMNNKIVVGIGNIYASEVLFKAKIDPRRVANTITLKQCEVLVKIIKETLQFSITQGGTTIRNYSQVDGSRGAFADHLQVYDREGQPCPICANPLSKVILGQRSTFYCSKCQR